MTVAIKNRQEVKPSVPSGQPKRDHQTFMKFNAHVLVGDEPGAAQVADTIGRGIVPYESRQATPGRRCTTRSQQAHFKADLEVDRLDQGNRGSAKVAPRR